MMANHLTSYLCDKNGIMPLLELFAVSCHFADAVVVTSFNLVAVHRKLSGKRNLD